MPPFMPTNDDPFSGVGSGGSGFGMDPVTMMLLGLGQGILGNNRRGGNPMAGGAQGLMQGIALAQQSGQKQREMDIMDSFRKLQGEKLRFEVDDAKSQREAAGKLIEDLRAGGYLGGGGAGSTTGAAPGGYIGTTGQAESGGSYTIPNAKGSGAYGKYQFMPETWADVASKNPDLQLPFNIRQATPEHQEAAMQALTRMNAGALQSAGLPVNPTTLYTAHRFGPDGAKSVLAADPNTPISTLFPPVWTEQNPDLKGVSVGRWLQGASQRFAGAGVPQGDAVTTPTADPSGTPLPPRTAANVPAQQPRGLNLPLDLILGMKANKILSPMADTLLGVQQHQQGQANIDRTAADAERRWQAEQTAARDRETESKRRFELEQSQKGEYVRGADGNERWVPASDRTAGAARYDKPPEPGTVAGDIYVLSKAFSDPNFAASPEYMAAHNRAKTHLSDGPNGTKLAPPMGAYPVPTFGQQPQSAPVAASPQSAPAPAQQQPTAAPPAAQQPVPPVNALGMTQIGDRNYNESQNKAHYYTTVLNDAIPRMLDMLDDGKGGYTVKNLPTPLERMAVQSSFVPGNWNTDRAKKFNQIVQDIVAGTLRPETGSAIQKTEYERQEARFIPQAGDPPAVVKQKIDALLNEARAFADSTGRDRSTYPNLFAGQQQGGGSGGAPYQPSAGVPIYDLSGKRIR